MNHLTNNNNKHEMFMNLIRRGIAFSDVSLSPLTDVDWKSVREEASIHAISPIVFDGMSRLPKEKQPGRDVIFLWYADVRRVEARNKRLNLVLKELVNLLEENDMPFVMMKGQGVAQRYPNPLHRCSGDIDLLMLDGCLDKAVELLVREGGVVTEEAPEKHVGLVWHGVVVELHHTIIDLYNPKAYDVMNGVDYRAMNTTVSIPMSDSEAFEVPFLEPAYELVYQLTHILHHLLVEGIGLRQVCDFALSMDALSKDKVTEVRELLRRTKLTKLFAAMSYICIEYLGADTTKWVWTYEFLNKDNAELLFAHIMKTGNFGRKSGEKVSGNTLWGNIQNAWTYVRYCVKFYPLVPGEVKWMLIVRTKRWCVKKLKR